MPNLRTDTIPHLIWSFTLPTMIGTLANTLYVIIDRIFIGQGVGAFALSGLALTFPIINILTAFSMLVSFGAASVTSLFLGSNDRRISLILPNTLFLSLLTYAIIASVCLIFLDPILTSFGGSPQTIPYAKSYLQIIIPGHLLTSLSFSLSNIIRAAGNPSKSMRILLFGAILNIFLDALFIFVFHLGICGAAYATVISMLVSTVWALTFFFNNTNPLSFSNSHYRLDFQLMIRILSIGLAPFLLQLCNSLVNVVMNTSLQLYGGDLAIGAFGIITSYISLIATIVVGLAQGLQPIFGFNHGAGLRDRVNQTLRLGIIIATIITLIGWLFAMLMPMQIARCFNSTDEILIRTTANGLRFYCLMLGLTGFHIVVTNYYQSIGRPHLSIILTFARQVLFLIPFMLALPSLLPPFLTPLNSLWLAQPASTICSTLLALFFLYRFPSYPRSPIYSR